MINPLTNILADSGYHGIQRSRNAIIPIKKTKNSKLSIEEKNHNRKLSSKRIKCENIIGFMKRFKIMSTKYRNRRNKANLRINLIAGICNFEIQN
jgi:hypothetical protein